MLTHQQLEKILVDMGLGLRDGDPIPVLLLTPRQAARALGVSPATISRLTAAGSLRCIRIGRLVRIPIAELDRWIVANTTPAENGKSE